MSDGSILGKCKAAEPALDLGSVDRAGLFAAGCCDHCIEFFTVEEGKVFRKHQLSLHSFPLTVAIRKSGLPVATAMRSGNLLLLDPMSGNSVCGFPARVDVITSMVSTFGGSVMIWKFPEELRKELDCRHVSLPLRSSPSFSRRLTKATTKKSTVTSSTRSAEASWAVANPCQTGRSAKTKTQWARRNPSLTTAKRMKTRTLVSLVTSTTSASQPQPRKGHGPCPQFNDGQQEGNCFRSWPRKRGLLNSACRRLA